MFTHFSLRTKMTMAFVIVAICLLTVGGISFVALAKVSSKYSHVADVNLPNTVQLTKMRGLAKDLRTIMNMLGLPQNDQAEVERIHKLFDDNIKSYDETDHSYAKGVLENDERGLHQKTKELWRSLVESSKLLFDLADAKNLAGRENFYRLLYGDFRTKAEAYYQGINALIDFQTKESHKWVHLAEGAAQKSIVLCLAVICGGFLLSILIGLVFSKTLSTTLLKTAKQLSRGAHELADASVKVSVSSISLSESATEQAAALQESMASIEQVSAMISKTADNAINSQQNAVINRDTAVKGKRAVEKMLGSINEINVANTHFMKEIEISNAQIAEIVKLIVEIGTKTKVINDIVFQTKILSFNASVEAARAGEHGKGFAVVAEEVGKLAQMSGQAAKEISSMLEASIKKVEQIVNETRSKIQRLVLVAKEKVDAGVVTAKDCSGILDEMLKSTEEIYQMVSEISVATREQAQGVEEINKAISQLDEVTQKNAIISRESAQLGQNLTSQASGLRAAVQDLLKTVSGNTNMDSKTAKVIELHQQKNLAIPLKFKMQSRDEAEGLPSQDDPRFKDI